MAAVSMRAGRPKSAFRLSLMARSSQASLRPLGIAAVTPYCTARTPAALQCAGDARMSPRLGREIGSASGREKVCQYVEVLVVAHPLKKQTMTTNTYEQYTHSS